MQHTVHLIKATSYIYFDNEITPGQKNRKGYSAKSYLYRVNNRMGQKKYLATVSATVEAKYDREWFIGELVVNKKNLISGPCIAIL